MSCPDLVAEVGLVEAEINEADEAQTQAKRAMDAERQSRYGRKKSPLGELLSTTADILEGVKKYVGGPERDLPGALQRSPRTRTPGDVPTPALDRVTPRKAVLTDTTQPGDDPKIVSVTDEDCPSCGKPLETDGTYKWCTDPVNCDWGNENEVEESAAG